jgi:hypothetical protein
MAAIKSNLTQDGRAIPSSKVRDTLSALGLVGDSERLISF